MKDKTTASKPRKFPGPQQVREYLRNNPEFLTRPDTFELLAELRIPHKTAGSISLLEYQIKKYRETNAMLVEQLEHLVMVHEANERTRIGFIAVLNALHATTGLDELMANLAEWWTNAFDNIDEAKLVFAANEHTRRLARMNDSVALYSDKRPPREIVNAARSQQHEFGKEISEQLAGMFSRIQPASFLLLGDTKKGRGAVLLGSTSAKRFSKHVNADFALSIARASINRIWDLYIAEGRGGGMPAVTSRAAPKATSQSRKKTPRTRSTPKAVSAVSKAIPKTATKPTGESPDDASSTSDQPATES